MKDEVIEEHIQKALKTKQTSFMEGTRVQMLIDRSKGNTNKGSARWVNKLISYDEKSYIQNIIKLYHQMESIDNEHIRIYASVNTRNTLRATQMLLGKTIEQLGYSRLSEYMSLIKDKYISCLMQPENRASKLFLIDCDTKLSQVHKDVRGLIEENLILDYETPNGRHFIIKPFDTRFLLLEINGGPAYEPMITVKKDALMLIWSKVKDKETDENPPQD